MWRQYIDAQTRKPDAIHVQTEPDDPNRYWDENVSIAREICRQKAIREGYDYLWYVDTDVLVPAHGLEELIRLDKDIVAGKYCHKEDGTPFFWKTEYVPPERREEAEKRYGKPTIIEEWVYVGNQPAQIHKAGTGCMLIKRKVFQRVGFPKKVPQPWTEDIIFCVAVMTEGFELWAHPGVLCQHIGASNPPQKLARVGKK